MHIESIPIGISLPKKVIKKIDTERRDISRSRYILKLIQRAYKIDSLVSQSEVSQARCLATHCKLRLELVTDENNGNCNSGCNNLGNNGNKSFGKDFMVSYTKIESEELHISANMCSF